MTLLDTHVVIWLAFEQDRVSRKAREAIDTARGESRGLAICGITLLELAQAASRGRIKIDMSLESFLADVESRFVVLPVTALIAAQTVSLPASYPKDPADRLIGATALIEDVPLITADRRIQRTSAIPTIW